MTVLVVLGREGGVKREGGGREGEEGGEGGREGGKRREGRGVRNGGEWEEEGKDYKLERHHTCMCTSFKFPSPVVQDNTCTHPISHHDITQFPTSVKLMEEVAARRRQPTLTYLMILPDCIILITNSIIILTVPTASPIGLFHLIRVPPHG